LYDYKTLRCSIHEVFRAKIAEKAHGYCALLQLIALKTTLEVTFVLHCYSNVQHACIKAQGQAGPLQPVNLNGDCVKTRRQFIQIVPVASAAALLAACGRKPEEKLPRPVPQRLQRQPPHLLLPPPHQALWWTKKTPKQ
jgi:hypothetical protein